MTNTKVYQGFRDDKKVEEHWSNAGVSKLVQQKSHWKKTQKQQRAAKSVRDVKYSSIKYASLT